MVNQKDDNPISRTVRNYVKTFNAISEAPFKRRWQFLHFAYFNPN